MLLNGGSIISEGSGSNLTKIVRYNLVQEQATTNWAAPSVGRLISTPFPYATNLLPTELRLRFTALSTPACGHDLYYGNGADLLFLGATNLSVSLRDCEFYGGNVKLWEPDVGITNCLFARVYTHLYANHNPFDAQLRHCTFFKGSLIAENLGGAWVFKDNIFELDYGAQDNDVTADYNAYATNSLRFTPYGSNDVLMAVSNLTYNGIAGRYFYLPTNSPLIDKASQNADVVGLWQFTALTNQVPETNSISDLGYHRVALNAQLTTARDGDSDGVPDHEEDLDGDGSADNDERHWWIYDSDRDYDGVRDLEDDDPDVPTTTKLLRLSHYRFDTNSFPGDSGEIPNINTLPEAFPSWSTNGAHLSSSPDRRIRYRESETTSMKTNANLNCRNGTVRFWFKPRWTSARLSGNGPSHDSRLIELGAYDPRAMYGLWQLALSPNGNTLGFTVHSNGIVRDCWLTDLAWTSNRWNQIALTYSPSNLALYINGQLTTNSLSTTQTRPRIANSTPVVELNVSEGVYVYPSATVRVPGFRVGNDPSGQWAEGDFEELETFNYPLSAQDIARDFPNFNGAANVTADTDYDGRSDLLEYEVDGTSTNDPTSVVTNRLGYWRFNGAITNLLGEQGQAPLLTNQISVTPGWSSNALVFAYAATSRLVYRDVEPNGWANINCQQGAARFWFKPAWTSGDAAAIDRGAFLYLGQDLDQSQGRWELGVRDSGQKIRFITAANGVTTTNLEASCHFVNGRWYQVAFNYGSTSLQLFTNGVLVTNVSAGVASFPSASDRTNGLVIGGDHGGNRSIYGQIDEFETFNTQLTSNEVWRSFEVIQSMDSDLNGTPDLLEDRVLSGPEPFIGRPLVVTGVIEAEHFDFGGKGIAYTNVADNSWTNDYRPSQMQITNCTDRGGGYCVDNLRAGEWLKYTLDVRVGQTYAIEPRVAGIGTGAAFHIEFFTNGVLSASATNFTIPTSTWTSLTYRMVPLSAGTQVMKVTILTNSVGTNLAARLNYISIYPSWNEGVANLVQSNTVSGLTNNDSSWAVATNNSARIQAALDSLTTNGFITIPSGTYYVAQKSPVETNDAHRNTAVILSRDDVEVRGEGKTNTLLVAHNRVTTIFYVGIDSTFEPHHRTNVTFRDLALEGRPHQVAVTNSSGGGFTNRWESGALNPSAGLLDSGALAVAKRAGSGALNANILFTNCLFRNPAIISFNLAGGNSNCAVRNCEFWNWIGNEGGFTNHVDTPSATTTNLPWTYANVFGRPTNPGEGNVNFLFIDNIFNGNPSLTNVTGYFGDFSQTAADGLIWCQGGGNWFAGRNAITNYALEAIQFTAGPSAVADNVLDTWLSSLSATALNAAAVWPSVSGSADDYVIGFVGNAVRGGRCGQRGEGSLPLRLYFSGNTLDLYPAYNLHVDEPGGAVVGWRLAHAVVTGNSLVAGGHGVEWKDNNTNAIVLKNDFSRAWYRALSYSGTNGAVRSMAVLKNQLGLGTSFHLKLRQPDAGGFFLWRNSFTGSNGVGSVNAFLDSAQAPVHFIH